MSDRASELRAIADGRLMLRVRNGVTVARSMLARIADEFETMSTALAAKDAELAKFDFEKHSLKVSLARAEAQLAEAIDLLGSSLCEMAPASAENHKRRVIEFIAARRAREAQGGDDVL